MARAAPPTLPAWLVWIRMNLVRIVWNRSRRGPGRAR
jgi:hypothetical protein